MSESERFAVFPLILKSFARFCNLKAFPTLNLANPEFAGIALSKKGESMSKLQIQIAVTIFSFFLRWSFVWTKSFENVVWPIVNNAFFLTLISWLFTLGYYVKHREELEVKSRLHHQNQRIIDLNNSYVEMKNVLKEKLSEVSKEKERFFVIVEKMVEDIGMNKVETSKAVLNPRNVFGPPAAVNAKDKAALGEFI
jgi:hypothetical protein